LFDIKLPIEPMWKSSCSDSY